MKSDQGKSAKCQRSGRRALQGSTNLLSWSCSVTVLNFGYCSLVCWNWSALGNCLTDKGLKFTNQKVCTLIYKEKDKHWVGLTLMLVQAVFSSVDMQIVKPAWWALESAQGSHADSEWHQALKFPFYSRAINTSVIKAWSILEILKRTLLKLHLDNRCQDCPRKIRTYGHQRY